MGGKPKSTLINVWVDRSKEYSTPLDPWSQMHYSDEGIIQSMITGGAPWEDHHHRYHLPDCKEDTPDDLHHPSFFDFL